MEGDGDREAPVCAGGAVTGYVVAMGGWGGSGGRGGREGKTVSSRFFFSSRQKRKAFQTSLLSLLCVVRHVLRLQLQR